MQYTLKILISVTRDGKHFHKKRSLKGKMKTKTEQFSATNPNPVLSVEKDGTVLYSNEAGEPLLREWGIEVREKLPHNLINVVTSVTSINAPQKIEVKAGNRVYSVAFHPLPEEECVNIYGFDISDQKELEEKLRESEEKYHEIVETANEDMVLTDAELRITSFSEKLTNKVGYSKKEVIGRPWLDFVDEEDRAVVKMHVDKRRQGIDETYEFKFRCRNGSSFWALISAKSLFDKDGKFAGALSMLTDITERKLTEEKLVQSERQYSALFNARTNSIAHCRVVTNEKGKPIDYIVLKVNDAYEESTGIKKKDIEGRKITEVFPGIEHYAYDYIGNFGKVALEGTELEVEVLLEPLQEWLSIYVYSPIYGEFTAIFTDITERKQADEALRESEGQFHSLAEAMPQIVWITRADGWNIYFNHQWVEYTGLTLEESYGHGWNKPFHPDDQKRAWNAWQNAVHNKGSYSLECRLRGADGFYRWWLIRGVPFFNESGAIDKWFGTCTDIHKIKHAEEMLQAQNERLQEANEALSKSKKDLRNAHDSLEERVKERTAELEKAYSSVKESEESHAEAQEMAHIGNWDWDLGTKKLYWSTEMYRIFGLNQELIVTYDVLLSHLHPDDRDYVDNAVKGAIKGKPFDIDHRIVSADGKECVVHAQGKATFDEKNNPIRLRGTVQDITERKKIEEALRESEERLRRFYESGMIGVFYYNMDGSITDANEKLLEMIGYTREDLLAGRIKWDEMTTPEYRPLDEYAIAELKATGLGTPYEKEFIRKDGSRIPVILGAASFDQAHNEGIAFVLDITERKKAEEEIQLLANIVESSWDAIITKSLDGIITSWNKGAEQIYGYSAEEVVGKPISIMEPSILVEETAELAELIKQGDKIHSYETLRLRKGGTIINVSLTLSPVSDASGELTVISVIARDITKIENAEKELQQSEGRYRIVTEQTGQMVYDYDFRTDKSKWTGAIEEITGYNLEEFQKLGKDFWTENILDSDPNRVYKKSKDKETITGCLKTLLDCTFGS
jgi:PAS domain S-box-containing protein